MHYLFVFDIVKLCHYILLKYSPETMAALDPAYLSHRLYFETWPSPTSSLLKACGLSLLWVLGFHASMHLLFREHDLRVKCMIYLQGIRFLVDFGICGVIFSWGKKKMCKICILCSWSILCGWLGDHTIRMSCFSPISDNRVS